MMGALRRRAWTAEDAEAMTSFRLELRRGGGGLELCVGRACSLASSFAASLPPPPPLVIVADAGSTYGES